MMMMIIVGLTQLEYPFLFSNLLAFGAAGIEVVAVRDVLLITMACLSFARLWRSTRRQRGHLPRPLDRCDVSQEQPGWLSLP